MTKNLTKLWAGGMRRLLAIQNRAAREVLHKTGPHAPDAQAMWRTAQTAVAQAAAAAAAPAASEAQVRPAPAARRGTPVRESRVGPRAAA
ncbi:MAG TPA: hypothetical protein VJS30_08600, partial [Paraburkholderia sp.]|nr:hypothetical protein [Paraburkholderia sp.]